MDVREFEWDRRPLGQLLNQCDQFLTAATLPASEIHQLAYFKHEGTTLLGSSHAYASTTSEVDRPFITKNSQRAQDGVSINTQHGREVNRRRKPFTGFDLSIRDGFSNFRGDLIVQSKLFGTIYLDIQHGAM